MLHQNNLVQLPKLTEQIKSKLVKEASERPRMTLKELQSPVTEQMKVDQSTIYSTVFCIIQLYMRDTKEAITQKEWCESTSRVYP